MEVMHSKIPPWGTGLRIVQFYHITLSLRGRFGDSFSTPAAPRLMWLSEASLAATGLLYRSVLKR